MVETDQVQYLIQDTPNMTGQPVRPPGYPKSGDAKKGCIKMNTRRAKDTIRQVFYDDLERNVEAWKMFSWRVDLLKIIAPLAFAFCLPACELAE